MISMARAAGGTKLELQIIHGGKKYSILLELFPEDDGGSLSVLHLMKEVAKVTDVPVKNQRLIVKGKSLIDPDASLEEYGIKNGTKVMLIGKKTNEQDESFLKQISAIATHVEKTEHKLNDIEQEVDGIQKGFLDSQLQDEALKKLNKRVVSCLEEFSKQIECCDGLLLGETTNEIQQKRKRLVNRILELQSKCDRLTETITDLLKQNESS